MNIKGSSISTPLRHTGNAIPMHISSSGVRATIVKTNNRHLPLKCCLKVRILVPELKPLLPGPDKVSGVSVLNRMHIPVLSILKKRFQILSL